jgi:hypothetical protein
MSNYDEHLFMCLLAISIFVWWNVKYFAHFKNQVIFRDKGKIVSAGY